MTDSKVAKTKVSLWDWFLVNLKIGALSFGGSGRLLLYEEETVDRRKWLELDEFREILTVAQMFPGPNLVNLAMYLGLELSGWCAATVGIIALALPGTAVALVIAVALNLQQRDIEIVFTGFSLASVFLFSVFIWRFIGGLKATFHASHKIAYSKLILRGALALLVVGMSLWQLSLLVILLVGIGLGLLLEFLVKDQDS